MQINQDLLSIPEASKWATEYLGKQVTNSNISYLIQYGRVKRIGVNGQTQISKQELLDYYKSYNGKREVSWKKQLGDDVNWALSFDQYKESETTKHVHRLHPYKGKFIPQLVEYFLDNHTDEFKTKSFFSKDDIVLDPFCGSGTTLVQASELGLHSVGIDISPFNVLISNCKVAKYDIYDLQNEITRITNVLKTFIAEHQTHTFEEELLNELSSFNNKYFPSPQYKYRLRNNEIDENSYGNEKELLFLTAYETLLRKYDIKLQQNSQDTFLDKWYLSPVRAEIEIVFNEIKKITNRNTKKLLSLILSRTMRSCRATTHADLATLIEPVTKTYYCSKHGKICKPLFSILKWWNTYTKDTLKRLTQFQKLRTHSTQICLTGDSRSINLIDELRKKNSDFAEKVSKKKIRGIFSSPPYVGLINYHEQHAYAYDLFGFERNDELEIGPLFKGKGKEARKSYIQGIAEVLSNTKQYLISDYDIFLVANDKFGMYPEIAEKAGMKIINEYTRPVLNRTEKDKRAYSEKIFHLKEM